MVANSISLTNRGIMPRAGQAALLPNQPIIHGCLVSPTAVSALVPGAVVALADDENLDDTIVIKQADVKDTPCGVVVYNAIKSAFVANDRVSVFPVGSFVYMTAGAANIKRGTKLQFTAENKVVGTATAEQGYVGIAWTSAALEGDLIIVQIQPSVEPKAA